MPYQKTKEGRLVNEITLGDGYPLSNDKQPLKVGGEASIINVSSPTPDNSVDGEVEVKGKLRAKDTFIQGDLKVFSDSDVGPQYRFQSRGGQNCQFILESAANTLTQLSLKNNQGSWHLYRKPSTTSLQFNDGTNTPLTLDGNTATFAGDVTVDTDTLHVDSSNNRVGIGTTSPDTLLHLASSSGDVQLKIEADTDNDNELDNPQVLFAQDGGAVTGGIGLDGSNNMRIENIWSNDAADVVFHASNAEKMRITGTGNVGIGTTSPSTELEVNGDITANELILSGDSAGITIENNTATEINFTTTEITNITTAGHLFLKAGSSKDIRFGSNNTDSEMTLDAGKLGIGTTSPTTTLDVEGTVSYKHISVTSSSDAVDVSGATVVECTPSGNVSIGGFTGGVQGQVIHILKVDSGFGRVFLEHNEGTGNQDIFLSGGGDIALATRGGVTLYCTGSEWIALDK